MSRIAIIPARSGSKGLKDKNIKMMCGKPLMAYSIQAALDSECFDTVMVSTDSEQYKKIAIEYGAEVPFLRSTQTSGDGAGSWDVVKEVLERYKSKGKEFQNVCLLQPTSPLRTAEDIKKAYQLYKDKKAGIVISVCEVEHPTEWCNKLDETLSLDGFIDREMDRQRQSHMKSYRINGALYIVDTQELYRDTFLYRENSYAYIMEQNRSYDIDTELDFKIAEMLMKERDYAAS